MFEQEIPQVNLGRIDACSTVDDLYFNMGIFKQKFESDAPVELDPYGVSTVLQELINAVNCLAKEHKGTANQVNDVNREISNNLNLLLHKTNKMENHISYIHNCATCGHPLELPENRPIFHCKYCGSVYVIGPTQIHSEY